MELALILFGAFLFLAFIPGLIVYDNYLLKRCGPKKAIIGAVCAEGTFLVESWQVESLGNQIQAYCDVQLGFKNGGTDLTGKCIFATNMRSRIEGNEVILSSDKTNEIRVSQSSLLGILLKTAWGDFLVNRDVKGMGQVFLTYNQNQIKGRSTGFNWLNTKTSRQSQESYSYAIEGSLIDILPLNATHYNGRFLFHCLLSRYNFNSSCTPDKPTPQAFSLTVCPTASEVQSLMGETPKTALQRY